MDLAILPKNHSTAAKEVATNFTELLQQVKENIQKSNNNYKEQADLHRQHKIFKEGELVMIRIRKERYLAETYHKFQLRKLGPFAVKHRINNNANIIDMPSDLNYSATSNVSNIYKYHPPDDTTIEVSELEMSKRKGLLM